ncbi:hypothetical protein [Thalassoglobus sp.]
MMRFTNHCFKATSESTQRAAPVDASEKHVDDSPAMSPNAPTAFSPEIK